MRESVVRLVTEISYLYWKVVQRHCLLVKPSVCTVYVRMLYIPTNSRWATITNSSPCNDSKGR